jgi:hypothetical protein
MASMAFHADDRRLSIQGLCTPSDRAALVEAIENSAAFAGSLVVDMTDATWVSTDVAEAIVVACESAARRGPPIQMVLRRDAHVGRLLQVAQVDQQLPHVREHDAAVR